MYEIKAHEVIYKGAHFRSKNECKRYIFLKELGWNIEYEPVLEDIKGWLPDLIIFGADDEKILVEIKPYQTLKDFNTNYAEGFEKKIHASGWYNNYDAVVIFGSTLNLKNAGGYSFIGGRCFRTDEGQKNDYKNGTHLHSGKGEGPYYEDHFVYTDNGCNKGDIDICDQDMSYIGLVHGSYDGGWSIKDSTRNKIETAWNHAGTEMRYVKRIGKEEK